MGAEKVAKNLAKIAFLPKKIVLNQAFKSLVQVAKYPSVLRSLAMTMDMRKQQPQGKPRSSLEAIRSATPTNAAANTWSSSKTMRIDQRDQLLILIYGAALRRRRAACSSASISSAGMGGRPKASSRAMASVSRIAAASRWTRDAKNSTKSTTSATRSGGSPLRPCISLDSSAVIVVPPEPCVFNNLLERVPVSSTGSSIRKYMA